MKTILCLCGLMLALQASAGPSLRNSSAGVFNAQTNAAAGGGGSCPADGSPNVTQSGSTSFLFLNSDERFIGQYFTNTVSFNPCKFRAHLFAQVDISAITFKARIYAVDGSGNIVVASPLAESNPVTGSNAWTPGDPIFTFASPPALSANTAYAFVVMANNAVGTTKYVVTFKNTSSTINGHSAAWRSSDGTQFNPGDGSSFVCAIYWY